MPSRRTYSAWSATFRSPDHLSRGSDYSRRNILQYDVLLDGLGNGSVHIYVYSIYSLAMPQKYVLRVSPSARILIKDVRANPLRSVSAAKTTGIRANPIR